MSGVEIFAALAVGALVGASILHAQITIGKRVRRIRSRARRLSRARLVVTTAPKTRGRSRRRGGARR